MTSKRHIFKVISLFKKLFVVYLFRYNLSILHIISSTWREFSKINQYSYNYIDDEFQRICRYSRGKPGIPPLPPSVVGAMLTGWPDGGVKPKPPLRGLPQSMPRGIPTYRQSRVVIPLTAFDGVQRRVTNERFRDQGKYL